MSEPYYSQHACSVCVSLSAFFICSFVFTVYVIIMFTSTLSCFIHKM